MDFGKELCLIVNVIIVIFCYKHFLTSSLLVMDFLMDDIFHISYQAVSFFSIISLSIKFKFCQDLSKSLLRGVLRRELLPFIYCKDFPYSPPCILHHQFVFLTPLPTKRLEIKPSVCLHNCLFLGHD